MFCFLCSVHRFPPLPAFDNYAYGACVYYMGTQQHLMKVLEAQQGRLSDFVVPPAEVEQTCQKYGFNQEFAFRFILVRFFLALVMMIWAPHDLASRWPSG